MPRILCQTFLFCCLAAGRFAAAGPEKIGPITLDNPRCVELLAEMTRNRNPSHFGYLYGSDMLELWDRVQAEESRRFLHVPPGKRADLQAPFLALFDDTRTAQAWGVGRSTGLDAALHQHNEGYQAFSVSRQLGYHRLTFIALRADFDGHSLPKTETVLQLPVPEQRSYNEYQDHSESSDTIALTRAAYEYLYRDYAAQGKGRRDQLGTFRAEDREAAARTTHFLIELNGEVVAHLQAQFSDDPSTPLNLEIPFGKLNRRPGEKVLELGRLFVAKTSQLKPETAQAIEDFGGRDLIRTLLYQRVFSWVNTDAKVKRVVMQMNGKGRDHFLSGGARGFGQWRFDDDGRRVVDEPDRQEWIFSISGENLLRTEEEEMLSLLQQQIAYASRSRVTMMAGYGTPANILALYVRGNEFPVVERLKARGALPALVERTDFPAPEYHSYDYGVQRFNPHTAYLFFRLR